MRIAVSGNIGAGKSTLCDFLSHSLSVEVHKEPVYDNPYLEDFYRDPARWAYPAQVFMVNHRFHQAVKSKDVTDILFDRCFHEDYVFGLVNHELGFIDDRDWSVYLDMYDSFQSVLSLPEVVIYLRTSPATVHQRIKGRGRAEEMGISLDYLQRLHDAYERWVQGISTKTNVLTFDWSKFDSDIRVLASLKGHLL